MTKLLPVPRSGSQRAPDGSRFHWGAVVATHSIGDIDVVEFLRDLSRTGGADPAQHGVAHFHPYIGGHDTHCSYATLDQALVGAIAEKHEGENGRAAWYFFRMVGMVPWA